VLKFDPGETAATRGSLGTPLSGTPACPNGSCTACDSACCTEAELVQRVGGQRVIPAGGERVGLHVLAPHADVLRAVRDAAVVAGNEPIAVRVEEAAEDVVARAQVPVATEQVPLRVVGGVRPDAEVVVRPVAFGSGNRSMISRATGSIRSAGIVLFRNGRPVSGSRTVPAKMPWRSRAVGTTDGRMTPCVSRVASTSPKKNALRARSGRRDCRRSRSGCGPASPRPAGSSRSRSS